MGDAAADGSPVAHRAVGDLPGDEAHHAVGGIGNLAVLDLRVGDARPDDETVAFLGDCLQRVELADFHHQVGLGETQVHHRPERHSPAERLVEPVGRAEEADGVGDVAGARVIEFGRFHAASPCAPAIAARTRLGDIGVSLTSAP